MKKILVPIDFSENSLNALRWGVKLAEKADAKLHVVHIYEYSATYAQSNYLTFMESIADSVTKNLMKDMRKLENDIPALKELKPKYDVSFNFALKGITDYISEHKIDFVIMGTRGNNDLTNKLMGSITSAVIDNTSIPVLAIPEKFEVREIKNIVFAVDYTHIASEKALEVVGEVAQLLDAHVKILHVSREETDGASIETDEVLKIAKVLKDTPHSYAFSVNKDPDMGILDFVAKDKSDLLVILPQKHGFFFNIFKRSVTDQIVHKASIPMLSIKGA